MDKLYRDSVTGEKVTLEEWNRRNNKRQFSAAKTTQQHNLLQGLNIPKAATPQPLIQPNIQRAAQTMSKPTVQPTAQPRPTIQSTIQSALKPVEPVKPILNLNTPAIQKNAPHASKTIA